MKIEPLFGRPRWMAAGVGVALISQNPIWAKKEDKKRKIQIFSARKTVPMQSGNLWRQQSSLEIAKKLKFRQVFFFKSGRKLFLCVKKTQLVVDVVSFGSVQNFFFLPKFPIQFLQLEISTLCCRFSDTKNGWQVKQLNGQCCLITFASAPRPTPLPDGLSIG
jgi:hypothetical protein